MSVQSTIFNRIVTLDPAATEILFKLGIQDRVVAVSHDSDFPSEATNRKVVSFSKLGNLDDSKEIDLRVKEFARRGESLYDIDSDQLTKLGADLIITQDLCGLCAVSSSDVEKAVSRMRTKPAIYSMRPPRKLEDILDIIVKLGRLVAAEKEAVDLVNSLKQRIQRVRNLASSAISKPYVACVEWIEPLEVSPSWVPQMLEYAHAILRPTREQVGKSSEPWPYLAESRADVLIVSPCSFKTDQTRKEMEKLLSKFNWKEMSAVRNGRAYMIDSDYLNRAGLRLVDGLEMVAALVQPEIFLSMYSISPPAFERL